MNRNKLKYDPSKVIDGTFAKVIFGGREVIEATEISAKYELETQEIKQFGTRAKGTKITGATGSGSLTITKILSFFLEKLGEPLLQGKTPTFTIVVTLDDPDSDGAETIVLNDCVFKSLDILNAKAGSFIEQTFDFNFSSFDIKEKISY